MYSSCFKVNHGAPHPKKFGVPLNFCTDATSNRQLFSYDASFSCKWNSQKDISFDYK